MMQNSYWVADYLNNSQIFQDSHEYDNPHLVYMVIQPNIYKRTSIVTLFTIAESDIDVSKIAETMHGGGHFHAAGFEASYITCTIDGEKALEITALEK
jgi:nanoRNase/pAp phosphatase (c-di-AMP/oligoRNAs hydrolase)